MDMFIKNKVYYKIFDLSFKESTHIYSKKNEDPQRLKTTENNRKAIIDYHHAENIVVLKQVHGSKIINADLIVDFATDLEGDGIITTKKNLILAIETADCVPLLLASKDGKMIGAAHCGWRGAKAGIVNNLVNLMKDQGTEEIYAIICPSIQQYSYEVSQEFYNNFIEDKAAYAQFFIPSLKPQHYMFDLVAYVELQLQEVQVNNISKIIEDTYTTKFADAGSIRYKYPSYRRCCHTGELYNSNILSTIIIT